MIKENLLVLCNDEVREFYNNLKQHSLVLKKDLFDGYISLPDELLCDIFCSFYLENSDIKKRDEINSSSIQNYYLLENILNHYHFKNIRSFVEKHKNDVFLILEIFANEFVKLIQSKKKINEIFKTSKVFFEELKNKHSEDVASQNITKENLVKFKKGLKSITGDLMIEVYKTFNKLKSLLILTRGNDLNPASIIQIPYNEKFVLAEKLSNFKIKEIIKIYTQANLQNKLQPKKSLSTALNATGIFQEVFYLNIKDDDQKEKYRKWIDSELENFNPELKYGTLTVYIKCGHPESRTNELETFALFFEILEVARLENRNLIVIVSGMETNEKTYIFAPLDVAIYDNNNTEKVHTVNGIIMILNDLLSGAKPPKPKMSLNISFKSSNVSAQKKKIFKTKPIMIKLG